MPALFIDGQEFANHQVPADHIFGLPLGSSLLAYAVVLGPGNLATFDVLCTAPVSGSIHVVDSAAQQSMVVLEDGRTVTGLTSGNTDRPGRQQACCEALFRHLGRDQETTPLSLTCGSCLRL